MRYVPVLLLHRLPLGLRLALLQLILPLLLLVFLLHPLLLLVVLLHPLLLMPHSSFTAHTSLLLLGAAK